MEPNMSSPVEDGQKPTVPLRLVALNSLLGGVIFGYNLGIAASFLGMIEVDFDLNSFEIGVAASSILMGGMVGSCFAGHLADSYGRRKAIIFSAMIGVVSPFALAFTNDLASFSVVRAVVGIPVGILTVVIPMYTAEATPDKNRGTYGVIFQFAICIGFLLSYIVALCFCGIDSPDECYDKDNYSWRYQVGLGLVPSVILLFNSFVLPESPRWSPKSPTDASKTNTGEAEIGFIDLLQRKTEILLGIMLAATLQLTGVNAILFFAPDIFEDIGINETILATTGIGIWNCFIVYIAMKLVDRVGRRPLYLTGVGLIVISTFATGIAFATLGDDKAPLAVIGIAVFMVGFQIGPGSLFFVVTAEIFDDQFRGKAVSFLNFVQWIFNLLLGLFFKSASDQLGKEVPFFFFCGIGLACWIVMFIHLKETRHGYQSI